MTQRRISKYLFSFIFLVIFIYNSYAQEVEKKDEILLKKFDNIEISGDIVINILPSKEYFIELIYSNYSVIKFSQLENTINISMPKYYILRQKSKMIPIANIYTPNFNSINIKGNNLITLGDFFKKNNLNFIQLNIEGKNNLDISKINTKVFNLKMSGANTVNINELISNQITINITDNNIINAKKIITNNSIFALANYTKINIIEGNSDTATIKASGHSNFFASRYIIDNITIKSTGFSKIITNIINSLHITAKAFSNIQYYGNPKIQKTIAKTANFSQLVFSDS